MERTAELLSGRHTLADGTRAYRFATEGEDVYARIADLDALTPLYTVLATYAFTLGAGVLLVWRNGRVVFVAPLVGAAAQAA